MRDVADSLEDQAHHTPRMDLMALASFNMEKYEPRAKKNHFLACVIDEKMKI